MLTMVRMATQFAMLRFELKTKLRCTAFFIRTKDPEDPVKILKIKTSINDVSIYYPRIEQFLSLPARARLQHSAPGSPFARLDCPAASAPALTASHGDQAFVLTVHDSEHAYLLHLFTILIHSFCYLCY